MDDNTVGLDQSEETVNYEVSDEALEAAAGTVAGVFSVNNSTWGNVLLTGDCG